MKTLKSQLSFSFLNLPPKSVENLVLKFSFPDGKQFAPPKSEVPNFLGP